MSDLLERLNQPQREAVTAPAGALLVLAGAGSGKTRVLTHRVAWLLAEHGVEPGRVAGITFTNKAAEEMRTRLAALVGPASRALWLHTFHALGARLLREFGPLVGVPAGFAILDDDDALGVVRDGLRAAGRTGDAAPGAVQAAIGTAKDAGLDAAAYARRAGGAFEELVAAAFAYYERTLTASAMVDFDDLIGLPTRLLEGFPEAAEMVHERIRWVLVDEYQDTSPAQYRMLRAFAGPEGNVTCVGDPDQSIYSWRGADIRNILEFERDFPAAKVVTMEQNYRSTGRILASASALIAHNKRRRPKRLWTEGPLGRPVASFLGNDDGDEARFVGDGLARWIAGGAAPSDFAILYRTHAQSRPLEEALVERGLPYAIFGGVRFYARREVKDLLSYARLLANPADRLSLARALAAPPRGLGETALERLFAACDADGAVPLTRLADPGWAGALTARARQGAAALLDVLNRMAQARAERGWSAALVTAAEESGYVSWMEARNPAQAAERAENLGELLAAAREAEEAGLTLEGFLERASLLADADRRQEGAGIVTLMTLHNAKGLEFKHVFITGLEEGLLPHASSLTDEAELEEERRLFYVGLTRARESAVLAGARGRRIRDRFAWTSPSRFLAELPDDAVAPVSSAAELPLADDAATRDRGGAPARGRELPAPAPDPDAAAGWGADGEEPDLKPGDAVRHEHFGGGRVVAVQGSGRATRVVVSFARHGRRTFLAGMARLERVRELA